MWENKLPASICLLENAVSAASACSGAERRTVSVKAMIHKNNLLILMENAYEGEVVITNGLPQASHEGHGYGTRSIAAIADAHGGQAVFSASQGVFALKIMLPLGS